MLNKSRSVVDSRCSASTYLVYTTSLSLATSPTHLSGAKTKALPPLSFGHRCSV